MAASLLAREFVLDFAERPAPGVTWGRRVKSRARRSLQLGSYDPQTHVARVHPVLDQPGVPAWFVRYVLFHEILHAALPARTACDGRAIHHGPAFRAREREYEDYARALRWQRRHLGKLIRSARNGVPARPRLIQGLLFRL